MKKHFVIFGIGVVMIVTAALSLMTQQTKAATNYSATWTIGGWRNVAVPVVGTVSLGPSTWNVSGSVGGVQYTEQWTANEFEDFRTNQALFGGSSCGSATFSNSSTAIPSSIVPGGAGATTATGRYGLYGGGMNRSNGSGVLVFSDGGCVFSSIPSKWTVTGTINN